ncbi:MAG: hypothetical protein KDB04_05700 [Acidimicrobiales bacterium]|nr:hypothetical protein [Acidimicrobiales bacterium]
MEGRGHPPLVVVEAAVPADASRPSVLAEVAGRPALESALLRLAPLGGRGGATIVVATTDRPVDDAVADLAEHAKAAVVRSVHGDLVEGLAVAMAVHGADTVVRISRLSPYIDPFVVRAGIDLHRRADADYTSNLLPRTYPRGLDVEVLSAKAVRALELEAAAHDRAHPTVQLRRAPHRFRLASFASGHDLALEDWSLDEGGSLERVREIAGLVPDPLQAGWSRILSIAGRAVKPKPGTVALRPLEPPEPGTTPWRCGWDAVVDGEVVGQVALELSPRGIDRVVAVPDPWTEPARQALARELLDVAGRPGPIEGRRL